MTSKIKLMAVAAAAVLLQVSAAHASVTLDWSFTADGGLTGAGAFTADQDLVDPATYHLTSATGTIGGEAVSLASYDGSDNQAYPGSAFVVDSNGIGFQTASGFYNLYEFFTGLASPIYDCGASLCIEGPNDGATTAANLHQVTSLSITARADGVPEPAAWALMLLGFGGLGAAMRQRRRVAMA